MKPKFLVITLLALSLLAGCSNSDSPSGGTKEPGVSQKLQKTELKVSDVPKDWKVVNQQEQPMFTTDWNEFETAENKEPISYSISYPSDWALEYSVFTDKDGQKVAELLPAIILSQGQKPFDSWKPSEGDKLISRKAITLGDLTGQRIITETIPDDGPEWYPHNYCLAEGDKAFMIIFYERRLGSGNEKLFDKIVSTLKFH